MVDTYEKMAGDMALSGANAAVRVTPVLQRTLERIISITDTFNTNNARATTFCDRVKGQAPTDPARAETRDPDPHCLELALERALNSLQGEANRGRDICDRLDGIA